MRPNRMRALPAAVLAMIALAPGTAVAVPGLPIPTAAYPYGGVSLEPYHYDTVDTPQAATLRLGAFFFVPRAVGGRPLRASKITKDPPIGWRTARFTFSDDVRLDIRDAGTPDGARRILGESERDKNLGPHVRRVTIGRVQARAIDRLDVPTVSEADGSVVPGTGVTTGAARVSWCLGRFELVLYSESLTSDELLAFAREAWPSGW